MANKGTPRGAYGPRSIGQPPPPAVTGARGPLTATGQFAMAPGTCGRCGHGTPDRGVIDMGLQFRFYGRLYLCGDCAREVGAAVGMTIDDGRLRDDLESVRAELREALAAVARYETMHDLAVTIAGGPT